VYLIFFKFSNVQMMVLLDRLFVKNFPKIVNKVLLISHNINLFTKTIFNSKSTDIRTKIQIYLQITIDKFNITYKYYSRTTVVENVLNHDIRNFACTFLYIIIIIIINNVIIHIINNNDRVSNNYILLYVIFYLLHTLYLWIIW